MSLAEEGGSEYDFTTPHHYPSAPLQQRPQHVVVRRTSSTGHFNAISDAAGDGWVLPGAAELQHGTWTEYQRDYVPSLGDSHAYIAAKVTEATTSSPDSVAHQAGWPELRHPPHQAGTAPSLMVSSQRHAPLFAIRGTLIGSGGSLQPAVVALLRSLSAGFQPGTNARSLRRWLT